MKLDTTRMKQQGNGKVLLMVCSYIVSGTSKYSISLWYQQIAIYEFNPKRDLEILNLAKGVI